MGFIRAIHVEWSKHVKPSAQCTCLELKNMIHRRVNNTDMMLICLQSHQNLSTRHSRWWNKHLHLLKEGLGSIPWHAIWLEGNIKVLSERKIREFQWKLWTTLFSLMGSYSGLRWLICGYVPLQKIVLIPLTSFFQLQNSKILLGS